MASVFFGGRGGGGGGLGPLFFIRRRGRDLGPLFFIRGGGEGTLAPFYKILEATLYWP